MSLYASRDGALYQSYDDFAGVQGFYEPSDGSQQFDPYAGYIQAPSTQIITQPQMSMQTQMSTRNSYGQGFFQAEMPQQVTNQMIETVMVPMTVSLPKVSAMAPMPPAPPQPTNQYEPVPYGPNLRGVGIKFGERIDSQSGGMHVYVKRVVPGSPAEKGDSNPPGHRIMQGDSLLLINGEDVYGLGLDILRERIPGPVGTVVTLGFKSMAGDLFEVELVRSAYALGMEAIPDQKNYYPHQQNENSMLRVPRNQAQTQNANAYADNLYASVADNLNGYAPTAFLQRVPSSNGQPGGSNMMPARTMQIPIVAQNTVRIPIAMDQMQMAPMAQTQFFEGDSYYAMAPMQQQFQYQYAPSMEYSVQPTSQYAQPVMYAAQQQYTAPQAQYQFAPQFSQAMPQMMPVMPMQQMGPTMAQMPYGQMQGGFFQ